MNSVVSDLQNLIPEECGGDTAVDTEPETSPKNENGSGQVLELGRSVCYIVGAVLINEGRVVLIKEAKPSCRGKWYFPAGRLDPNESLVEGVKREVLEETGFEFEPTSLVCVDTLPLYDKWFRFTFVGRITGGKLKTLAEQDKESMEANWFTKDEISQLDLRAKDFLPLVDFALKWDESRKENPLFSSLPVKEAHSKILARVVMVARQQTSNEEGADMLVLLRKSARGTLSLPAGHPSFVDYYVFQTVESFIKKQGTLLVPHTVHGLISIEHVGKPHGAADGMCLTLLAEATDVQGTLPDDLIWFPIKNQQTCHKITELIQSGGCIVHHTPGWY